MVGEIGASVRGVYGVCIPSLSESWLVILVAALVVS
jgi:hypothetical protein